MAIRKKCRVTTPMLAVYSSKSTSSTIVGSLYAGTVFISDGSGWGWQYLYEVQSGDSTDELYSKKWVYTVQGDYVVISNYNTETKEETEVSKSDASYALVENDSIIEYSQSINSDSYLSSLEEGLEVKDLRGIFGMPHQFLPTTDPRIDGSSNSSALGRKYSEKIIEPIPLVLITPGEPEFMSSFSESQKRSLLSQFINMGSNELDSLLNEKGGKYYSLKFAYTEYFHYVNAMLRSAAYFLGIENEKVDGKALGSFNWLYYNNGSGSTDIFGHEGLFKFLGPYAGAIPVYADGFNSSIDESYSNSTGQSALADKVNGLSDQAREINFIMGNVAGMAGMNYDNFMKNGLAGNLETVGNEIDELLGKGNILSNITGKVKTIMTGGKMVFPEIWSDSSASKGDGADFSVKLVSPSGDKLSVYLNILVPIYHLLALTLPRQSAVQAYSAPFLVRAYSKGIFNIDMGIVSSLSISKGAEGEWTNFGLPTVANVRISIKDLYGTLYMSTAKSISDLNIMSNVTELDYIANSCGINVNEPDIRRTIKMYYALKFNPVNKVKDWLTVDIFGGANQYINQKINNIFGRF